MKKSLIVLALIVLGLVIVGCATEPSTTTTPDADLDAISAEVNDLNSALDSDLTELDALDQELADIEALDLG
jgi:outer membrane murein-binding lipoprotein Lpp